MSRSESEDRASRRIYHLSHCIMRMKHRYGLDLNAEDYDGLCKQFSKGEAIGVREDDKRHREGWLQFKGTWVCLSYIPSLKLIGTVMPCPPPRVLEEMAKGAKGAEVQQHQLRDETVKRAAFDLFQQAMMAGKTPKWLKVLLPGEQSNDFSAQSEELLQSRINELASIQAKKMAYTLFDQAMNAGKAPKWLQQRNTPDEGEAIPEYVQQHAENYIDKKEQGRVRADPSLKKADLAWFKLKLQVARDQLKEGRILDAAVTLDAVSSLPATFHPSMYPEESEKLLEYRDSLQRGWMEDYFRTQGIPESVDTKGP